MATLEQVLLAYVSAWSEPDKDERRAWLEISWAEHGVYSDPSIEVCGREALVQHIGRVLKHFAGQRVLLTSGVDVHHSRIRFTWAMVNLDGKRTAEGSDFGEIGSDGRLTRITGFFGPIPSPPSSWPDDLILQPLVG